MKTDQKSSDITKATCFVIMGFGKKTDFELGRTLDLDKSYQNMIKPAVEAAGLTCIRADEIVQSGLIDIAMYEQLLKADVVVADLSTSNRNAFYELGVRHALRPYTTIVVAEDGIKTFPFDVNHVAVRQYKHLGEDIGYGEVMRFSKLLTKTIIDIINKDPRDKDSPVYSLLNGLVAPEIAAAIQDAADRTSASISKAKETEGDTIEVTTQGMLMKQAAEAEQKDDWIAAKALIETVLNMFRQQKGKNKDYDYIIQKLAYVTYKSKHPTEADALNESHDVLMGLNPNISNDTETLSLWGRIHEQLWNLTKDPKTLDEAVRAYERGLHLRNDFANGINFAYLLNVRSKQNPDKAEAIADFVQARRVRKEVISICERWLNNNPFPENAEQNIKIIGEYWNSWYKVMTTMAEAYIGLENESKANDILSQAYKKAPDKTMKECTREQIEKLKQLIANSPINLIKEIALNGIAES